VEEKVRTSTKNDKSMTSVVEYPLTTLRMPPAIEDEPTSTSISK
jgi:hypothetical protein